MRNKTLKIDRAGRIVLPVAVRKRLNLLPGDELKLTEEVAGIRLEPQSVEGELVRKGSVLVFTGQFSAPLTSELIQHMIREDRDQLSEKTLKKLRRK